MDRAINEKRESKAWALIEAMRCHQWVKNGFVFAAPVFARRIFVPEGALATVLAFIAFCLGASAIYILNDLIDLRRDRMHPLKKSRPISSGRVSSQEAVCLALALAAGALTLSVLTLPLSACIILIAYLLANVLYTTVLKHLVILDVMFIAVGFLLRVLMGACAASAPPSHWLLLCTLNVSLFLGFTKRRAELVAMEERATDHREVLEHYSHAFLDQMIAIVTGATLVCYILYTVDARTVEVFHTRALVATVPFVLYGVFRYLYLSYHRSEGGSPTRAMLKDRPFQINMVCWGLTCLAIIYWGQEIATWSPW